MAGSLLLVTTGRHRYAANYDDTVEIRMVASSGLPATDHQGRPYVGAALGPLLDPADTELAARHRALVVPLRRRLVALLVNYVEELPAGTQHPLPALLRERLRQPWAMGAFVTETELFIQIDLRAVARSVLAVQPSERTGHG